MLLNQLRDQLAWPRRSDILNPPGAGPHRLSELAKDKIGRTIAVESPGASSADIGLLMKNPHTNLSEPPIAIVCEFKRPVGDAILALAHRLAWNFARSPLLITIEPDQVRTWTCCEQPAEPDALVTDLKGEIREAQFSPQENLTASQQAAHALHWVRLVSGELYRRFPERFRRDGRADHVLLEELTDVRKKLKGQGLEDDTIHDLLARVVFTQFLFDRKDSDGQPALNPSLLARLQSDGHLAGTHVSLESILSDYHEAYRFFRWLNTKFNGDLFPGKGQTEADRENEWQKEMQRVKPRHLQTLADFVGGRLRGAQRVLWRQYSFDVIPLEFISSIYEEFVSAKGAYYTPGHLVDFILDEVLPWEGVDWNLRILDPACGSGIFLVKAYQRLIQRWKNRRPGERPQPKLLRAMLERNLFGVDLDPHAVRVASFSLYLTMCDEIDPKTYLNSTKFPRLRDRRLVGADFFREDTRGFSTEQDGRTYDLVIGNAPWGEKTETQLARDWASHPDPHWDIPDKAVGTLFLAKAATLTRPGGRVSMIQPASSLLFNRSGPAKRFRGRLFTEFKVEEVVNLSALRFELFGKKAISPACILTLRQSEPDGEPIIYISPKQIKHAKDANGSESDYAVIIEPQDITRIWPEEAASDPLVWTALAWGGRRDLALVRRLSMLKSLRDFARDGEVTSREGIIRGNIYYEAIVGRPVLEEEDFPSGTFLRLDPGCLKTNRDPSVHRRTDLKAFQEPQLLVKQGWLSTTGRFQAALCKSGEIAGVICSQSYLSVHASPEAEPVLDSATLTYNSMFAVYYLLLTSGRLASYRPEPLVDELRSVPIPPPRPGMLEGVASFEDVDDRIREEFGFKAAEWALIQDLFQYTMPDFKGDETSPGRQPTRRNLRAVSVPRNEPHLAEYCRYFLRVLRAGFGDDKSVCATIYQDPPDHPLPVRLVGIHLDWARGDEIQVESIDSSDLCQLLVELDQKLLQTGERERGGVFFQRVAKVYDVAGHRGREIPTIYLIKPDRIHYWTRSVALRDADEVAADIHLWLEATPTRAGRARGRR